MNGDLKKYAIFFLCVTLWACQPTRFQKEKNSIHLVGDSTMAEKREDRRPETGWGEKLHLFFEAGVRIENHAVNGRSTKSFRAEGRWDVVLQRLVVGDIVFIQFGHNDSKQQSQERYASPDNYRENLERFVNEGRARGAQVVLLTPVVRRRFDQEGGFFRSHGEYPQKVRDAAKYTNAPLIDIQQASEEHLISLGKEASEVLYLWLEAGEHHNYPEGVQDNTHFSEPGATRMADLVVQGILATDLDIKRYLNQR